MDKKQLIKCNKALHKIEKLDSEIINIEKIALLVSDGKFESHFELKIKNLSHKNKESQDSIFDEDGSLKTGGMLSEIPYHFSMFFTNSRCQQTTQEDKNFDFVLNPVLSESSILKLLGLLLTELQKERGALLGELQKYGVEI